MQKYPGSMLSSFVTDQPLLHKFISLFSRFCVNSAGLGESKSKNYSVILTES